MISVLHLIDTTGPGGAETVFCTLADKLRERGFRSIVVVRGRGWLYDELERRGLEPRILDAKGSFNWRYLRKLRELILSERVDLIQSHLLGSNVYAALAGGWTGRPVVAAFHGQVDVGVRERFRMFKFLAMQRYVSRYVAVSESLRRAIAAQGLLDAQRTTVIYNGVDFERFAVPRHRKLADELGLPADSILAGALGNIRPAKAYEVLVGAAALLCDKHPRLHFVVAGHSKGLLRERLQEMLAQRGLAKRVHFVGFREDVPGYLAGLGLFVLSSVAEGFSIATIEAQAAGLPVVATRCGGPEEIVSNGKTGMLVAPADPNALAGGIDRLLREPDLAETIAGAGRESAIKRFSIERMVHSYAHLYGTLVHE